MKEGRLSRGEWIALGVWAVVAVLTLSACLPLEPVPGGHAKIKAGGWGVNVEEERDFRGPSALEQVKTAREVDEEKRKWQADDMDDLRDQLDDLFDSYDPVPNGLLSGDAETVSDTARYCAALSTYVATLEDDAKEAIDRLHVKPLRDTFCEQPPPAMTSPDSNAGGVAAVSTCPEPEACPVCADCSEHEKDAAALRSALDRCDAQLAVRDACPELAPNVFEKCVRAAANPPNKSDPESWKGKNASDARTWHSIKACLNEEGAR